MNDRIPPVGAGPSATRDRNGAAADWTDDIELLQARIRELRRVSRLAGEAPSTEADRPEASDGRHAGGATGRSMLESLAYGQTVNVRYERPKRIVRKQWRSANLYDTTLGDGLMPDGGWKNGDGRGDR